MTSPSTLRTVFWALLLIFLAWDFHTSPAIDLRFEAPLIAAGSGQADTAGAAGSRPAG